MLFGVEGFAFFQEAVAAEAIREAFGQVPALFRIELHGRAVALVNGALLAREGPTTTGAAFLLVLGHGVQLKQKPPGMMPTAKLPSSLPLLL